MKVQGEIMVTYSERQRIAESVDWSKAIKIDPESQHWRFHKQEIILRSHHSREEMIRRIYEYFTEANTQGLMRHVLCNDPFCCNPQHIHYRTTKGKRRYQKLLDEITK